MRSTLLGPTALLATIAVLATACGGSSDDGGGEAAAGRDFCEQVVALDAAAEGVEGDNLDEESLDALRSLRDVAPDEVRADMTVLIDLFEKMANIDENDEGSTEEIFGLLFDPAVIEAGENVEAYGVAECGLEPEESEFGDAADGGSNDLLYNPEFGDPIDPNQASIDGLQQYLDQNYLDAPWRPQLSSWGQFGRDFEAGGIDIAPDAIAICEAVLAYATGFDAEATVEISTFSENFGEETQVATGSAADGCITV